MQGVIEGFAGTARAAPDSRLRRVLVINLDQNWEFSMQCRRSALDLYRDREPFGPDAAAEAAPRTGGEPVSAEAPPTSASDAEPGPRPTVDFWDVRETSGEPDEREEATETDRIWRHWPRSIHGGARGAVAELEEKLSEEVTGPKSELDRLTVLVTASFADLDAQRAREPGPVAEFLDGLRGYFSENALYRSRVRVVLLLNDWEKSRVPPRPAAIRGDDRSETAVASVPDAVMVIREMDSGAQSAQGDQRAAAFQKVRLITDLFRSEQFARSFFGHAEKSDRPLTIRIDTSRWDTTGGRYGGMIIRALRKVYREMKKRTADRVLGQADPFMTAIREMIFGTPAEEGDQPALERRTAGSYAIVHEVTKNFDSNIFPEADRHARLIRHRFVQRARDTRSPMLRPLLGGHSWSRSPLLEVHLEAAFIEFLEDAQEAIQKKLAGQTSVLAQHERMGIEERIRRVGAIDKLNLGWFGTGDRAKDNARDSRHAIGREMDAVERKISAFWDQFSESQGHVTDDLAAADVQRIRDHCPLMQIEWKQTQELIRCYAAAREAFADLMSRPAPWLWVVLCAALFLLLPLLWLGVWAFGLTRTAAIPVLGIAAWATLFVGTLAWPWYLLRWGHRRVEDNLAALDDAAGKSLLHLEKSLRQVAEYVGDIQRSHYLYRLRAKIAWLEKEADLVDEYVEEIAELLGRNAESWVASIRDEEVEGIVENLSGLGERKRWLDGALRTLKLADAVHLDAVLPGGDPIKVSTHYLRTSFPVFIEDLT